jgi:hypothetical protein
VRRCGPSRRRAAPGADASARRFGLPGSSSARSAAGCVGEHSRFRGPRPRRRHGKPVKIPTCEKRPA